MIEKLLLGYQLFFGTPDFSGSDTLYASQRINALAAKYHSGAGSNKMVLNGDMVSYSEKEINGYSVISADSFLVFTKKSPAEFKFMAVLKIKDKKVTLEYLDNLKTVRDDYLMDQIEKAISGKGIVNNELLGEKLSKLEAELK